MEQENLNSYAWALILFKHVLMKGSYELVDYDGIPLSQP